MRSRYTVGCARQKSRFDDLTEPDTFFILGRAPNQIDIITTIDGVAFEAAWKNRVDSRYGDTVVHYINRDDLIANKEAAGRPQDLIDVAYLRENG